MKNDRTDDRRLLLLVLSGKVAGKSLNMTGFGTFASHCFRSVLDQLAPSNRLLQHIVADDEVEVVQPERFKRSIHALCRLDRVALSLQNLLNRVPAGLIVVRD